MTKAQYTSLAYHRLNYPDDHRVNFGIVEFMETLCEMEDLMLDLETEVSAQVIDFSGWNAVKDLSELESRHGDFLEEIKEAHWAITMGRLTRLDRYPGEEYSTQTQHAVCPFDFKANTRLVLSISIAAASISFFSLLTQLMSMVQF